MALIELTTKDWVDPTTVRKVYRTYRNAPHTIHILVVECDGPNLQYEYKDESVCIRDCAIVGKVIAEAQAAVKQ